MRAGRSRVLLVEPVDLLARRVREAMAARGVDVERVSRGEDVLGRLSGAHLVVLHADGEGSDGEGSGGVDLCRRVRRSADVPVLLTSARSGVEDRVRGLHSGATDYLPRPYAVEELLARVRAVLRRTGWRPDPAGEGQRRYSVGGAVLEMVGDRVEVDGREVRLRHREHRLLELISAGGGSTMSRDRLVSGVWQRSWPGASHALDVHVATLRAKLDRPAMIETVRGVGYRLGPHAVTHPGVRTRPFE